MRAALALISITLSSLASAQVRPVPGTGDPRLQTVTYKSDQIVTVEVQPGYQVLIELAPDEQIRNIALGDSASWQASATRQGNRLYVKSLQAGNNTNMTVVTNARFYGFDLTSNGGGGPSPYKISFRYPDETAADDEIPVIVGRYHLHGDKALLPSRMFDDGLKTYIEWPPAQSLPAVFLIDGLGRESVANGAMRGTTYVVDDVSSHLLFRIDRRSVRADRYMLSRKRR